MKYVEPKYKEKAFTCPYCESFAQQLWSIKSIDNNYCKSILNYEIENTDKIGRAHV